MVTLASSGAEGGYLHHVHSPVYVLVHHPCGVLRGSTLSPFFSFNPQRLPWFGLSVPLGLSSLPLQRPSQVRVHQAHKANYQLLRTEGHCNLYMIYNLCVCIQTISVLTTSSSWKGDVCFLKAMKSSFLQIFDLGQWQ